MSALCDGQQLQEIGAIAAYVLVKRAKPVVTLNLMLGLEDTLTRMPWQEGGAGVAG